jgi:saccharopine dehydrogenase (NAD+, L-lysine forming)
VFTDSQFVAAGAALQEDVSPASVILGVKEVPVELLIPNRTSAPIPVAPPLGFSSLQHGRYMFFGHVIKAQPHRCARPPLNVNRTAQRSHSFPV